MTDAIDWVGGLPDETWRDIAAHAGWFALTLRSTCATLQKRVLTLNDLPTTIQIARRLLQHLDGIFGAEYPFPVPWCYAKECCTQKEREELYAAFEKTNHRDLFGTMDVLNCGFRMRKSGRRCWQLVQQLKDDELFWQVMDYRSRRIIRLDKKWNDYVLTDDELVDVMRSMHFCNTIYTGTLFRNDEDSTYNGYTTTWHAAASKGNLKVLHFLYQECNQPVHACTPDGNNALAHARRAMARNADLMKEPWFPDIRKLPDIFHEYLDGFEKCITFLQTCGLDDKPWRDDNGLHEVMNEIAQVFEDNE